MEKDKLITIDSLIEQVRNYIDDEAKIEMIKKAYQYAESVHGEDKRLSGEDYIIHPLNVAFILTKIHSDAETLCISGCFGEK